MALLFFNGFNLLFDFWTDYSDYHDKVRREAVCEERGGRVRDEKAKLRGYLIMLSHTI